MARLHLTQAQLNSLLTLTFSLSAPITISGAATAGGLVNLTATAHGLVQGTFVPIWLLVVGVTGTTEANGLWAVTIPDANHLTLVGSTFTNAYVSGGTGKVLTHTAGAIALATPDDLRNLVDLCNRVPASQGLSIGAMLAIAP